VERETWLPTSENDGTFVDIETEARLSAAKDEFVYGLGETTGRFLKGKRKYTLDPKDSLGYDPEIGDGMYKVDLNLVTDRHGFSRTLLNFRSPRFTLCTRDLKSYGMVSTITPSAGRCLIWARRRTHC
jgi:hypothetical protein